MINVFYLSPNNTGGWVTFTAHLIKSLEIIEEDVQLYKIGNRTEAFSRKFGYNVEYRNISIEDALRLKGVGLISAVGKRFIEPCIELLKNGSRIVIHDPTELHAELKSHIEDPIVIRRNNRKYFKESVFIPHPYVRNFSNTAAKKLKYKAISISRIDFDKHTEILLEANRLIKNEKDKIVIMGFENRLYTKFKIMPKYPEWEQSKVAYPREFTYASDLCRLSKFMVDMSSIKGDGGGTQYTFLEAMDAGSVCILNREWFSVKGSMKENTNCLSVATPKDIVNMLKSRSIDLNSIRNAGYDLLKNHSPKKIAKAYIKELGL